jgi:hypothetical protein
MTDRDLSTMNPQERVDYMAELEPPIAAASPKPGQQPPNFVLDDATLETIKAVRQSLADDFTALTRAHYAWLTTTHNAGYALAGFWAGSDEDWPRLVTNDGSTDTDFVVDVDDHEVVADGEVSVIGLSYLVCGWDDQVLVVVHVIDDPEARLGVSKDGAYLSGGRVDLFCDDPGEFDRPTRLLGINFDWGKALVDDQIDLLCVIDERLTPFCIARVHEAPASIVDPESV